VFEIEAPNIEVLDPILGIDAVQRCALAKCHGEKSIPVAPGGFLSPLE
jgi:hypothetical protein